MREAGRLQERINALQEAGHTQAAIDHLRQALAKDPQHLLARSNLLFSLSFDPNCSGEAYLEEARRYDDALKARWPVSATPSWPTRVKGAPLRIGVVSGDLRSHPVGYFLEGLLAALPKDRVQVVALSTRVQRDALSERLASHCTGWHVIGGMHPQAAAALIREQAIDVLEVFAQRAAPTQLSWLGYFASTGLSAMDAVLADALCVPEGEERACACRTAGSATHRHARPLCSALRRRGLMRNGWSCTAAIPRQAYLQAHAEVDFIVDSHPFPGGTTTCEALWMGVPTLTWRGHSMLSRQGECMMTVAGLPDWVLRMRATGWHAAR